MELKREQIIKALECCTDGDCYPCSYGNIGAGCRDKMCEDALSLIKELTEENKRLIKGREDITIVRTRASGKTKMQRNLIRIRVDAIRANTVRKMQERLKKSLYDKPSLFTQQRYIVDDVIDQIAKEMVEGTK